MTTNSRHKLAAEKEGNANYNVTFPLKLFSSPISW